MMGNNSSGTTSIQYGVTRDKVLEMEVILSDGSIATFGSLNAEEFQRKLEQDDFEGEIYKKFYQMLLPKEVQEEIQRAISTARDTPKKYRLRLGHSHRYGSFFFRRKEI